MFTVFAGFITVLLYAQPAEVSFQVNGAIKYQTMDGFGVNINTAWWENGEYHDSKVVRPAIDKLIDSLGATIFRAVIEEIDWEEINDDNDPNHFNWTYYNTVFSNARFLGVWNTLRYLNQKGIKDGLLISFMGAPPAAAPMTAADKRKSWMGGTDNTIAVNMEDELAESIAALLYYMRNTAKIQFHLVSPMNETDIQAGSKKAEHPDGIVEGPNIPDAVQYVRIIKKLAEKLDANGMSDVRFVAPDAGGATLFRAVLDETLKDPYLTAKMDCWGVHQYGKDAGNYWKIINKPANPNKKFWVTETAVIQNMLGQMDDDATAFIFWDGFDCVYQHGRRNGYGDLPPNDWVFWEKEPGMPLIAYDGKSKSWTPRKQFYEFAQVFRFIKPGAVRIGLANSDSKLVVHAFKNPNGQLVIVGKNISNENIKINGSLSNLPSLLKLEVYRTNQALNLVKDKNDLAVGSGVFSVSLASGTTFTLTETAGK